MNMIQITSPKVLDFFERNKHIDVDIMMELLVTFMDEILHVKGDNLANDHHSMLLKKLVDKISIIEETIHTVPDKIVMSLSSQKDTLLERVREVIQSGNSNYQNIVCSLIDSNYANVKDQLLSLNKNEHFIAQMDKYNDVMKNYIDDAMKGTGQNKDDIFPVIEKYIKDGYTNIQQAMDTRMNTHMQSERQVIDSIHEKLVLQKDAVESVNQYLNGNNKSSVKGRHGELRMIAILNEMFPDAEITDTSGESKCGDAIITRIDKPKILIDTKDYDGNVPNKEVDKIVRDTIYNNCSSILVSHCSGIANKQDMEVGVHDNHIIVYIHNCEYDPKKIRLAISMIDSLEPLMKKHVETNNNYHISNDILNRINNEYRTLANHKMELLELTKKQHKEQVKLITQFDIPCLSEYLNSKFQNTVSISYKCPNCDFSGKSTQSVSAHQRHCKGKMNIKIKKTNNLANINNLNKHEEEEEDNNNNNDDVIV